MPRHHGTNQPPSRVSTQRLAAVTALGAIAATACTARGTVLVGGPCTRDESCTTGVCIRGSSATSSAWAGGYCSGNCAQADCPQGLCLVLADGLSYCLAACQDDTVCRPGYVCSASAGACLPDCRLGWSCGATLVCDGTTGACTLPTTITGTTPLGGACSLNAECVTALCIPERSSNGSIAWTGGMCSQTCNTASCPAGAACVSFQDGSAYCVPTCATTSDCRTGYACAADVPGCLPDCRLGWSCGTLVCDPGSGTCVDTISLDAGIGDGGSDGFVRREGGGDGRGGFGPGPGGAWN